MCFAPSFMRPGMLVSPAARPGRKVLSCQLQANRPLPVIRLSRENSGTEDRNMWPHQVGEGQES